jgi:hypothetical protein
MRRARRLLVRSRVRRQVVISSFGFLLPHEGLCELIEAFSILLRDVQNGHLLMMNALSSALDESRERGKPENPKFN